MSGPIRADRVKPESVEWLWRERIPRGMISIVGGRPDQGKGLAMAHIAAAISKLKVRNPDGSTRWARILYSAIEDSHGLMTAPRLKAAGAIMDNVHLWRFQIPSQWNELEAILLRDHIDLLIMDPFAAHLSHGVTRHSDNIRTVLNPLTECIEVTRTAVIVVEHVLKRVSRGGHPLTTIGGASSGLPAAARMAFLFGQDPNDEDRRILAAVKSNIRELPRAIAFELDTESVENVGDVPTLIYEDEVDFDPMRLVETRKEGVVGRPPDKRAAAAEWLTNYLYRQGKPVLAGVIFEDAKHYGMSSKTLRRAAADMEVIKNPPGGGKNTLWSLPDSVIKRLDAAMGLDTSMPKPKANPEGGESLVSDDELNAWLGGEEGDG